MARILVVEDNPDNLELIRFLLIAFGHEPLLTTGGREGVEAAQAERPDLILMDIQMPEMDGFEALGEIRAQPAVAATPVVALTALAMVGDREHALRGGFDGYITKPIQPERFVLEVETFLPYGLRSSLSSGSFEPEGRTPSTRAS
jgi:two-component system cell cycle response regulator